MAERLTKTVPGSSFFLFGAGDPAGRGLVARRKEVGWFRRPVTYHALAHDLGSAPTERYGLTGTEAAGRMGGGVQVYRAMEADAEMNRGTCT